MKGLEFTTDGPLSKEAKEKLDSMMKKKADRLKKTQDDFNNGKLKIPGRS